MKILKGLILKLKEYVHIDIDNIDIKLDKYIIEMINNDNSNF